MTDPAIRPVQRTRPARHTLILGGAKSGKSRAAEALAADWLQGGENRCATLVATALPGEVTGDPDMAQRIERHRADRAERVPALQTVEAATALGRTLRSLADPARLIIVDCLTLWLTQCMMPPQGVRGASPEQPQLDAVQEQAELLSALCDSPSPVVLVSNEISLGVMPISREARTFIDALGTLHQRVAAQCARVNLMVAGCVLTIKEQ